MFIWKNIVCRFGIPRSIVSDNGLQFDNRVYRDFCKELNIRNLYSTPRYPQSNGQAEASNKTLLTALKKRLDSDKGKWVEELPGVLWDYRTTARNPTDVTLLALTYGMEVVIPTEIGLPTIRIAMVDSENKGYVILVTSYQRRLANFYYKRVRPQTFQPGDLVL